MSIADLPLEIIRMIAEEVVVRVGIRRAIGIRAVSSWYVMILPFHS